MLDGDAVAPNGDSAELSFCTLYDDIICMIVDGIDEGKCMLCDGRAC